MSVLHDIRCTLCEAEREGVYVDIKAFPACTACGGPTTWIPRGFSTDLHEPVFNHATGQYHGRARDAELEVARQCRALTDRTGIVVEATPAGDRVGGARNETRMAGTVYGYRGQGSRRSPGEAAQSNHPGGASPVSSRRAPVPTVPQEVNGIHPTSVTRDEAQRLRKSRTWDA